MDSQNEKFVGLDLEDASNDAITSTASAISETDMDVEEPLEADRLVTDHYRERNVRGLVLLYYVYVLVDPRNLEIHSLDSFKNAIFYVGKGIGLRSLDHLMEAVAIANRKKFSASRNWSVQDFLQKNKTRYGSTKHDRINKIWEEGHGVIIVQFCSNRYSFEALFREAAMIDSSKAIGLVNLTNINAGDYVESAPKMTADQKVALGNDCITIAWKKFSIERTRQIKKDDIVPFAMAESSVCPIFPE